MMTFSGISSPSRWAERSAAGARGRGLPRPRATLRRLGDHPWLGGRCFVWSEQMGFDMDFTWSLLGVYMAFTWPLHGLYMVFTWFLPL